MVYRLDGKHAVAWADGIIERPALAALLASPETICREKGGEVVKAGNTALVVRTAWPTAQGRMEIACKRVRWRGWFGRLKSWLRPHPVLRCWRLGHLLREHNIPTARPLAVILPRQARLRGTEKWAGILATEWIEGGLPLNEWLREISRQPADVRRREYRTLARQLAQLIARLHGAGIRHRDLKDRNIIVRRRSEEWEPFLIDLDGAAVCLRVTRRRRCRDIARLLTSLRQRGDIPPAAYLRFLKAYLNQGGGSSWCWKEMWRTIRRCSDQKFARIAGRQQMTGAVGRHKAVCRQKGVMVR